MKILNTLLKFFWSILKKFSKTDYEKIYLGSGSGRVLFRDKKKENQFNSDFRTAM